MADLNSTYSNPTSVSFCQFRLSNSVRSVAETKSRSHCEMLQKTRYVRPDDLKPCWHFKTKHRLQRGGNQTQTVCDVQLRNVVGVSSLSRFDRETLSRIFAIVYRHAVGGAHLNQSCRAESNIVFFEQY